MEMQQMMEHLLAKMHANWQETRATREKVRPDQELLKEEMLVEMETNKERVVAKMDSWLEKMEACLGKIEVMDLEINPEQIHSPRRSVRRSLRKRP
jgi:hypothetical protein